MARKAPAPKVKRPRRPRDAGKTSNPGHDIRAEVFREYEFGTANDGPHCIYRIDNPQRLFVGSTTHRVLAADGLVHVVPAPGYFNCVMRFKPRNAKNPVQF